MVHEFRPSGFGEAVLAFVLRWTLKLLLKPVFSTRCSIGFQRRWLAGLSKIAIGTRGVGVTAGTVGGVPGEWSRRTGAPARPGSILYLHGGAYCVGSRPRTAPSPRGWLGSPGCRCSPPTTAWRRNIPFPPHWTMPWPPTGPCARTAQSS
jgi:hypothetical protein